MPGRYFTETGITMQALILPRQRQVAAGALDVMLAGDAYYFGQLYHKKTIGDDIRPVEIDDIRVINKLMYVSAWIACIIMAVLKWLFITWI